MKQITVRLDDERVKALESLMEKNGFKTSQGIFEHLVDTYEYLQNQLEDCRETARYWQDESDNMAKDFQRMEERKDEKINLLRGIIEEGLGKKLL